MAFLSRKTIPDDNSGLTKVGIVLCCALQIGERTQFELQNGFSI